VSSTEVLATVVLAALLGAVGQSARFLVGMLPRSPSFQRAPAITGYLISLGVGLTAGVLGSVSLLGETIGARDVIALLVVGYAGTDAIEQFVKWKLPGARAS
jgi:hypothetical protein